MTHFSLVSCISKICSEWSCNIYRSSPHWNWDNFHDNSIIWQEVDINTAKNNSLWQRNLFGNSVVYCMDEGKGLLLKRI